ncbi:hypothetical protein CBR_g3180 [Chara braunii]|uniref:Uncharacterized protein n=1 Tax=Chara braunii TaxID=69332 RepID=A0A388KF15_CHABU|nr:hypothetical protein CBR_g3180 [Chara braunii]|eukprot:GBG68639.1 hypothetical protein CBR_g3180 [Chara braunii]
MAKVVEVQLFVRLRDIREEIKTEVRKALTSIMLKSQLTTTVNTKDKEKAVAVEEPPSAPGSEVEAITEGTGKLSIQEKRKRGEDTPVGDSPPVVTPAKLEQLLMAKAMEVQLSVRLGNIREEIKTEVRKALTSTMLKSQVTTTVNTKDKGKAVWVEEPPYASGTSSEVEAITEGTGKLSIREKRKRGEDTPVGDSPPVVTPTKRTSKRTGVRPLRLSERLQRTRTKIAVRRSTRGTATKTLTAMKPPTRDMMIERMFFLDNARKELSTLDYDTLRRICREEGVSYSTKVQAIFDVADRRAQVICGQSLPDFGVSENLEDQAAQSEEQLAMAKAMEVQLSVRLGDIREEIKTKVRKVLTSTMLKSQVTTTVNTKDKGKAVGVEEPPSASETSSEVEAITEGTGKLSIREKRKRGEDTPVEDSPLVVTPAKRTSKRTGVHSLRLSERLQQTRTKIAVRRSTRGTATKTRTAMKPLTRDMMIERMVFLDNARRELSTLDYDTLRRICREEGVSYSTKVQAIFDVADRRAQAICGESLPDFGVSENLEDQAAQSGNDDNDDEGRN